MSRLLDVLVRIAAPVLRLARVRVYQANLNRIGDMNLEISRYVKFRELGWLPKERAVVIPAPQNRVVANPTSLRYLRRHVRIVTSRLAYPLLFRIRSTPGLGGSLDDDVALPDGRRAIYWLGSAAAEAVWTREGRPPLLRLDPEHERRGRAALRELGVPEQAWFVCLHAREAGYLRETGDSYARHLNVDVRTYRQAVETVTSHGGWVIRMGDPTMTPLEPAANVVDYAHSPAKSDWLDVFLAARCRFWLGSNSGIYFLAESFGTPVAMTNLAPQAYRMWGPRTVIILKLYFSEREGRLLTFGESLAPEILHLQDLDDHAVRVVDNTPDEIDELVVEMLERIEERAVYTEADEERRRRYDSLTPYYPYGIDSRIGRDFLRRHEELLHPAPSPDDVVSPTLPLRIPRGGRRASVTRSLAG